MLYHGPENLMDVVRKTVHHLQVNRWVLRDDEPRFVMGGISQVYLEDGKWQIDAYSVPLLDGQVNVVHSQSEQPYAAKELSRHHGATDLPSTKDSVYVSGLDTVVLNRRSAEMYMQAQGYDIDTMYSYLHFDAAMAKHIDELSYPRSIAQAVFNWQGGDREIFMPLQKLLRENNFSYKADGGFDLVDLFTTPKSPRDSDLKVMLLSDEGMHEVAEVISYSARLRDLGIVSFESMAALVYADETMPPSQWYADRRTFPAYHDLFLERAGAVFSSQAAPHGKYSFFLKQKMWELQPAGFVEYVKGMEATAARENRPIDGLIADAR